MAASSDDHLHSFVEADDTPSLTAERIVELADGRHTVGEIAGIIANEFDGAPLAEVQRDVAEFVATLVSKHVLVLRERSSV